MVLYPIASDADAAQAMHAPMARTAEEATRRWGGPVFLSAEELSDGYARVEDAEAAFPGLYGDGRFELVWREGAWRVFIRYWRPAPPAPVARSAHAATTRPLGVARTPEEALELLGAPAELASEPLPRPYRTIGRARARWRTALESGLAKLEEHEGGYRVLISYWRPLASARLSNPERAALAERAAAPLRPATPQSDPYVGLFERLAPENPAIVLAEEGDGRTRGE